MARTFDPARGVQSQIAAMEDETPASMLGYYMTEFSLPVKVVAAAAGLAPPTLYQYIEAPESVRPSAKTEEMIAATVTRLHALAEQGKLKLDGSPMERRERLAQLLAVEESTQ